MKKFLIALIVVVLAVPTLTFAIPSSIDRIVDRIEPLIKTDYIKATFFVASSSTATSTFVGRVDVTGTTTLATTSGIFLDRGGEFYNVKAYGVRGDGTTDDTSAINAVINFASVRGGGTVYIPNGTYMIDPQYLSGGSIKCKTGVNIFMDASTTLQAIPNGSNPTTIISCDTVRNVEIKGGILVGDRYTHTATSGEQGHGIMILSAFNVEISDQNVRDTWGDGYYIADGGGMGGSTTSRNISFDNVHVSNARRNGLSCISWNGGSITNSVFENSNGTAPEAGIDFEANFDTQECSNIHISGVVTRDNAGNGIELIRNARGNTITGSFSFNNGKSGYQLYANTERNTLNGVHSYGNTLNGVYIDGASSSAVTNSHIYNNYQNGIFISRSATRNIIDSNFIYGNNKASTTNYNVRISEGSTFNKIRWNDFIDPYYNIASATPDASIYIKANTDIGNEVFGNTLEGTGLFADFVDDSGPSGFSANWLNQTNVNTRNIFFGNYPDSLTTGIQNTGIGYLSYLRLADGDNNTAIGYKALKNVTYGGNNTAIGSSAADLLIGSFNVAIGSGALSLTTLANNNMSIGTQSLLNNVVGENNVAIGHRAGYLSTGSSNIFIGTYAASSTTAGNNNILIGNNLSLASTTSSNQLNLGNILYGVNIDGIGSTLSTGNIGIKTSVPSTTLHVVGTTTTTNLALTGALTDSGNAFGSDGNVLLSTGTSTRWIATSSLGITSGGSGSNWSILPGGLRTSTSTDFAQVAYFVASSTTGTSTFAGAIGIGTTSSRGRLEIQTNTHKNIRFGEGVTGVYGLTAGMTGLGAMIGFSRTNDGQVLNGIGVTNIQDTTLTSRANFHFYTNGTERLTILEAGNVGIGSSTPTSLLSIASSTADETVQLLKVATTSDIFAILANGRVGIGTSTPASTLHVVGTTTLATTSIASTTIGRLNVSGISTLTGAVTVAGTLSATSPAFTTSITTPSTSFTAFAGATTLLTIGGTGASASLFMPSTLDTTSAVTGAIRTSGGISAAKAMWVGTTLRVAATSTLASTTATQLSIGTTTATNTTLFVNGTTTMNSGLILSGLPTSVTGNGVCISTGKAILDSGTTGCTPSSLRFKTDLEKLENNDWRELLKINTMAFNYKPEFANDVRDAGGKRLGMIAEDIDAIDTRLVQYDENGDPLSIHFDGVITLLVQAVQELETRTGEAKRTAEENWQWIAIGLLFLIVGAQQYQISKLKK